MDHLAEIAKGLAVAAGALLFGLALNKLLLFLHSKSFKDHE